jgi:hypothetical protein
MPASKPKKAKILIPPDRDMASMDTFPRALWMDPWFETREDALPEDVEFPEWMTAQAREEVLVQMPLDPCKGALWWSSMWKSAPANALEDPEFLLMATAMAATMGWPKVVENLLDIGAPIEPLVRPSQGWSIIPAKGKLDKPTCSLLDACLWGMRGFTTVAPLHAGRAQSLDVIFARGANPQLITWTTAFELISHGALANKFIDAGLQASHMSQDSDRGGAGRILMDVLFSSNIDLASAARGRVLDAFIRNGMPVHVHPEKPSLIEYMASSVAGVSQMEVALRHPDREALAKDLIANQGLLEKRAQRMSNEKRDLFLSRVLQVSILEMSTPQTAARPRPRI